MENNFNEQELNRRNAVVQMRELGIEPYPAALYEVNAKAAEIPAQFDPQSGEQWNVSIAGRIMSRRIMGAAAFIELLDDTGKIQVYIKRDEICEGEDKTLYNTVFKKLLDIGDIIGIKGFVFVTQTGQISVHAKALTVLSKSLRVLPIVKEKDGEVFDAFSDPELRYRQRYVDLIVNPHVRETFVKGQRSSQQCAAILTHRDTLRLKHLYCSRFLVVQQHVLSLHTITLWICLCIFVLQMSSI